ncbi:kinase-like domain-containing protein [Lobosporangium transversale]|uniref:Kinase-like domain-containing protein n=1 Tax=Lobosporangium transversale TaxID=64571 RepID=A0A1Y2GDU9_9FUNG|nr:kinase-like domain-containing protein [Lobosporangium transversale]ORZ08034.1 kinase-like domain-containing protein [Lobosporangium transversale]|eukprot:XP_021878268.1 kinase-like domain-containing protein [Lobosporangium transversale]
MVTPVETPPNIISQQRVSLNTHSSSASFSITPSSRSSSSHLSLNSTIESTLQTSPRQQFPSPSDPLGSLQHHPLPPIRSRADAHESRSQLITGLPSSIDQISPSGLASVSPSSWSTISSDTTPSLASSSAFESKVRFERLPQGGHRHHLSAPKRHQFLSNQVRRLRELLDSKRDHHAEDHTSPITGIPHSHAQSPLQGSSHQFKSEVLEDSSPLSSEKCQEMDTDRYQHQPQLHPHPYPHPQQQNGGVASPTAHNRRRQSLLKTDFAQKYGELQQVIGKGAFGIVKLSIKKDSDTGEEHAYAVKEFKQAYGESQKQYMRRLTSEFCIASSLRHINVIHTMDLLQLHGETYIEVMEYCGGGDMCSLIASANTLGESESNCFFSQLVHGVGFLHSMGVVHRDLKPENLLLTSDGCLKIADFGNSEVFRMPWEKKVRSSASIRGSGPFIAPEEFTSETFDARKVDMWACGVIYMCMRLGRYTWHEASNGDPIWDAFLYKRERFLSVQDIKLQQPQPQPQLAQHMAHSNPYRSHTPPSHINLTAIEQVLHVTLAWPNHVLDVIENVLEPDTRKRWQATSVMNSEWFQLIENCHPTPPPPEQVLDESDFEAAIPSQRVGSKVIAEGASVAGCKIVKEVKQRRTIAGSATRSIDGVSHES